MPPLTRPADGSARADKALASDAQRIAAQHAPAYVVIDEADCVVLFSEGTGWFLEATGPASLSLASMARPETLPELRKLIRWTRVTGRIGRATTTMDQATGPSLLVSLVVEPLPAADAGERRLLILFQQAGPDLSPARPERQIQLDRLASALKHSNHRLSATTLDLIASNADYQAAAEALEATNAELEVATEELRVLNGELTDRVVELDLAHTDIRNLLDSTRIAIVFLDEDLRIRTFTPLACGMFRLSDADLGRPLGDLTADVDYPNLTADLRNVLRSATMLEREIDGTLDGRRFLARMLPYRDSRAATAGVVLAFIDVSATHNANQARRESEERLHLMAASVPAFLFIARPSRDWDYVNPPFHSFTGLAVEAALGRGWWDAVHPDDREEADSLWRAAAERGSTMQHEIRFRAATGAWCWFLIRAVPQLDRQGGVVRWFGSCTDIDERRQAESRQGLMLADMQHRVKDILAVVRSLLKRTLQSSVDMDHFADHFAGRLGALARSQSVAARTPERNVMLEELVAEELAAHGGQNDRQVSIEGPPVVLSDKVASVLGLALHELTTNALKYGALSIPSGQIAVRWRLEPPVAAARTGRDVLTLAWLEHGVPLTEVNPSRRGFGRNLIEQGLAFELKASTKLDFRPGGLQCTIVLDPRGDDMAAAGNRRQAP